MRCLKDVLFDTWSASLKSLCEIQNDYILNITWKILSLVDVFTMCFLICLARNASYVWATQIRDAVLVWKKACYLQRGWIKWLTPPIFMFSLARVPMAMCSGSGSLIKCISDGKDMQSTIILILKSPTSLTRAANKKMVSINGKIHNFHLFTKYSAGYLFKENK